MEARNLSGSETKPTNEADPTQGRQPVLDDNVILHSLLQNTVFLREQLPYRSMNQVQYSVPLGPDTGQERLSSMLSFPIAHNHQQVDHRLIGTIPHAPVLGMIGDTQNILGQLTAGQQQPIHPNLHILANASLHDSVRFPLSSTAEQFSGGLEGSHHSTVNRPGTLPSEKQRDEGKLQVVSLSKKERKAGFPMPPVAGPGRTPTVGPMEKYRRIWHRLSQTASKSSICASSFVPKYFASSIGLDKNSGHLYRKIHHLPSYDEIERSHKRARTSKNPG